MMRTCKKQTREDEQRDARRAMHLYTLIQIAGRPLRLAAKRWGMIIQLRLGRPSIRLDWAAWGNERPIRVCKRPVILQGRTVVHMLFDSRLDRARLLCISPFVLPAQTSRLSLFCGVRENLWSAKQR